MDWFYEDANSRMYNTHLNLRIRSDSTANPLA